jgi:AmmeMemoRadiSam system protein B
VTAVRPAHFAGSWYPGDAKELRATIERATPRADRKRAIAVVSPHAGYRYSGAIAAETIAHVEVPRTAVVLCPNHRVPPPIVSVWPSGTWRTPLGELPVDEPLVEALLKECKASGLVAEMRAHDQEHAVELQLPILQFHRPDLRIVAIVVAQDDPERLKALGEGMARAIAGRDDVLIVASSDMNHYESHEVAERKDKLALDRVLAMDPAGLLEVCDREDITMCGVRPTAATLWAAKALGAKKAELVRHATSGDVSGEYDSVVGYAGVVVGK